MTTCDICGEVKECEIKHYDIVPDCEYDSYEREAYTVADLVEGEGYEIAICPECLESDDLKERLLSMLNDIK